MCFVQVACVSPGSVYVHGYVLVLVYVNVVELLSFCCFSGLLCEQIPRISSKFCPYMLLVMYTYMYVSPMIPLYMYVSLCLYIFCIVECRELFCMHI